MVKSKKQRVIVGLYGNGYSASLEDQPGIADWGRTRSGAIGNLVEKYPEKFNIEVVDKTAVISE
jgi:hypothetical protein